MTVQEGLEAIRHMNIIATKIFDGKLFQKGSWVKYLTLYCGFDIETTTIEERAYMYIWSFSVWDGTGEKIVIQGRKWSEFTYFIGRLKRILNLRDSTRVIVWIANMSFEFGFMQKYFEWSDLFAKERLKPLYARTGGIEFREALTISGGNLAYLAKTYCTTQKMVGDLDYTLPRNSKTDLTEEENRYCFNDVIILSEFSKYIFDNFIIPQKFIPLTSTAILRHEMKLRAKSYVRDINLLYAEIKKLFPATKEDYIFYMIYLFRGGYVHGRYNAMLQELNNLESYDLKSSYPATMLREYMPVTPFEEYKPENWEDFNRCLQEYCCIMRIRLYNVKSTTAHSIESKSKCIQLSNPLLDNGRIREADMVDVMLTELDFEVYRDFYSWENIELISFQIAKRGVLPRYLTDMVYYLFEVKESIDKEADPMSYAISKTKINGMYGMTVTRLQFNDVNYSDHSWGTVQSEKSYDEMISKQLLSPFWGIYITSWSRYTLLHRLMKPLADYVVYSDTDSHKFVRDNYTDSVVNSFNSYIISENQRIADLYGYNFNIIRKLGTLERETDPEENGIITRFKAAGAKRYICEYANKGVVTTIAGLGKKALSNYIKAKNEELKDEGKAPIDIFEYFDRNMEVPSDYTGKLRAVYNTEPHSEEVVDYLGNREIMKSETSVALVPVAFTMSFADDYYNLIKFWLGRMNRTGSF